MEPLYKRTNRYRIAVWAISVAIGLLIVFVSLLLGLYMPLMSLGRNLRRPSALWLSTTHKHWEFVIDFSELNGETLSEVGVLNEAEEGTLLLRKLLDPFVEKTSDKKATIIVEVTVARE